MDLLIDNADNDDGHGGKLFQEIDMGEIDEEER
jgi:hypothetical protein